MESKTEYKAEPERVSDERIAYWLCNFQNRWAFMMPEETKALLLELRDRRRAERKEKRVETKADYVVQPERVPDEWLDQGISWYKGCVTWNESSLNDYHALVELRDRRRAEREAEPRLPKWARRLTVMDAILYPPSTFTEQRFMCAAPTGNMAEYCNIKQREDYYGATPQAAIAAAWRAWRKARRDG